MTDWFRKLTHFILVFSLLFRPRTFDAVGVIFSEQRDVGNTVAIRKRDVYRLHNHVKKRSFGIASSSIPTYSELHRALRSADSNQKSVLTRAFNNLSRFRVWLAKRMYKSLPPPLKRIVKKFGRIEARIHKKIVCWKPRLQRRYGRLVYPNGLTVNSVIKKKHTYSAVY